MSEPIKYFYVLHLSLNMCTAEKMLTREQKLIKKYSKRSKLYLYLRQGVNWSPATDGIGSDL